MINTSGQAYTIQTIKNLTPATCGYPTRRTRTFIIGWRDDVSNIEVVRPLQCLSENTHVGGFNVPGVIWACMVRWIGLALGSTRPMGSWWRCQRAHAPAAWAHGDVAQCTLASVGNVGNMGRVARGGAISGSSSRRRASRASSRRAQGPWRISRSWR